MASRRKTAEDKNTKLLRELASLPYNKQCFDCLQRGPTYINVTIGSFVCTTCSGILRGLTPPHRVKSISMTTFTPEEIEHLKSRGNEYCKYVWLGTYDTVTNSLESEVSDDQKKRDFMVQKYEKKRWYVDPDIAVKKMQADQLTRQKNSVVQPQIQGMRTGTLPETQPLSRLLGKSPTPLVVQTTQPVDVWPHPVSSASAPAISTKTTTQNQGSRSIDLLSELAGNSTPNTQVQSSSASTANGNFANFETAFNSVEKSASSTAAPTANLPSSASLDTYPMQSRQEPAVNTFSPPLPKVTTTAVTATQQTNADRYAALADLDSLFHQPASTKAPSWTVETSSSGSFFDVPASNHGNSTFSIAPSNPFTSTELWNQTQVTKTQTFQSANPFQSSSESGIPYCQITNSQVYAPFPIPMVGNSPSDDGVRNQFNANFSAFPTQVLTSPTNGYGTNQMLLQNGGFTSPTPGTTSWGIPSSIPQWSSSHLGQGGLFSSEKSVEPAQHSDWIQNPVNPFMASSSNLGFPVAPRNNSSNPFL
ncbi:arf-GAP domain and FG repeat-containing protein 1-like isoform X2 [Stegodyphus dumicola]|uniref:arf-GAP domain and FG repeat-containing protein 1-like isoform X2 n=1 Tax=Stegodyphus dumicola TaxID=202533 RepID=UPI0015AFB4C7|nr:arf-GAP domain and FG repeat-containing protein 1-like isoform X2 [Stegodyphus dumicola]